MAYEPVGSPIPFREAFFATGSAAALSQSALFLLLRDQIITSHRGGLSAAAAANEVGARAGADLTNLGAPWLEQTAADFTLDTLLQLLPRGGISSVRPLAENFFKSRGLLDAAILLAECLHSDEAMTTITAAGALIQLVGPDPRLIEPLLSATYEENELAREVGATLLVEALPNHPRLEEMTSRGGSGGADTVRTSLLIHGTWARLQPWWRSGGAFHSFVQQGVWPDVYGGGDAFAWSGGYSDAARELAGEDLVAWTASHGALGPRLMAHSHGGNVAMLATRQGMSVSHLVLLSCPVHTRYLPDFNRVKRTTSIRVRLDLIILADRGGQRFRDSRIDEHVLPRWFDHSCTHDPAVWVAHNVAGWL